MRILHTGAAVAEFIT